MRIMVYPHDLGIGGSQLNAIELGAEAAKQGHDVTVFGYPGALVPRIRDLGLDYVESPHPWRRPSPRVLAALVRTIRDRRIQVVHGYEWPPILEAWLACHRTAAAPIGTVMSMAVAPFLPRDVPLLVGTAQIAAAERQGGRRRVNVLEPPVDLLTNNAEVPLQVDAFRRSHGVEPGHVAVVMVTRLAREMKLEGVLAAIDVVGQLAAHYPVRLIIVGDGPARSEVESRARVVNAEAGCSVVSLTGQLDDPRPAYAAGDILLGMGGSALRAMAFAKPLIVQGERGFWRLLSSDTAADFLWAGWYGVGSASAAGPAALRAALEPLLADGQRRTRLGAYSLELVRRRFALSEAAEHQARYYQAALRHSADRSMRGRDEVRSTLLYGRYFVGRYIAQARGQVAMDDFNSRPVAARTDAAVRGPKAG